MKKTFLILLFCVYMLTATAQVNTNLDAAQQQALDKFVYALRVIINKLNNSDWVLNKDYYDQHPKLSFQQPGAPMGVNTNFERVYDLKVGSPTYQEVIQPLLDRKKELPTNNQFDSVRNIDKKISSLSRLQFYANVNIATVNMQQSKNSLYKSLSLKGCGYSLQITTKSGQTYYYLLFGNWDVAQCESPNHTVQFKFKNPPKTPFIENIEIEIIGTNEDVQRFLNKTDWSIITNSLTI